MKYDIQDNSLIITKNSIYVYNENKNIMIYIE